MNTLPENFDFLSPQEKRSILSQLLREEIERPRTFPLSFSQERLWFLNQLEGPAATYNIWVGFNVKGPLYIKELEKSINAMIARHEILRTTFTMKEGQAIQVVADSLTITLPIVDLQGLPPSDQDQQVKKLLLEESHQPFDLAKGPLLRVKLLRTDEKDHYLLITMHHIICDGWSSRIFFRETLTFYDSFLKGKSAPLPALPMQFGDFSARQREWLTAEVLEQQLDYWKKQMNGAPLALELPFDRPRPPEQTFQGRVEHFSINEELKAKLQALSLHSNATLFMILLEAFALILSRYSSQEDIVIGTPIANRNSRELESLIGFFVNTLTIRIDLSGNPTFLELLKRVQNKCLEAYSHQDIPFEKLVEELQVERNPGYTPLFQVLFTLHHGGNEEFRHPELTIHPLEVERLSSKFDLTLQLSERQHIIAGNLEYNTRLFRLETCRRFIRCFLQALAAVLENPGIKLTEIEILTAAEKQQILYDFNDTDAEYPLDKDLYELFTQQAVLTPDHTALRCGPHQLTYRQSWEAAAVLAHELISRGVGVDIIVALRLERSLEMLVGIYGILCAGGAYLPIDPDYPPERIDYMLKDSRAKLLVTTGNLAEKGEMVSRWEGEKNLEILFLDTHSPSRPTSQLPNFHLSPAIGNRQLETSLAYVIYTSGSTGRPKGVMIEHGAVVNFINGITDIIPFTGVDRILSLTTVSFDIFGLETLLPLSKGALVIIGNREEQLDAQAAAKSLQREQITIFQVTPSRLQLLIQSRAFSEALVSLKYLLVGGEVFPLTLLERVKKLTNGHIFNVYGPTETTIWSTLKEVHHTDSLDIGKPLANTRIYILNKEGLLQPIGVPGEMIIAGDGVARGYLNHPGLTAEKFDQDLWDYQDYHDGYHRSYRSYKSYTIYRTGDLARWLPDGNIEFLGRKDKQVKIRGYRIELGEIENQLLKHPGIREAIVTVQPHESGDYFLSAYVVPYAKEGFEISELRRYLQERLPGYMVPDYYLDLEEFPLTSSGKVDIKSLPEIRFRRSTIKATYVAPNNELEILITDTWKKVLKLEKIGVHDNFFELGGNSFKAIELSTMLDQALNREIPVAVLFRYITIHSFTQYLTGESTTSTTGQETVAVQKRGSEIPIPGMPNNTGRTGLEIAVIGMAGRFPGAANIDRFWENLKNGVESISFIGNTELEKKGVEPGLLNHSNYVRSGGGVLEGCDLFDAAFFGYTPLETEVMDPQMRLLHEGVWETLEDAGYDPGSYDGMIGIYVGASHNFHWEALTHMSGKSRELGGFLAHQFIGRDFLATRISYKLDLKGPSFNVQTACSTSLVAIHLACQAILNRECHMALAGGARVDAPGSQGYLYQEGMIHSLDGHCRAFDDKASGTIGGNGLGVVMLKTLPDALRDNDHIYAIIKSTAINNDGLQKASYTAPSIDGQAKVIKAAIKMASIEPRSITYVETHGTGTVLGDTIEIEALKVAFADDERGFCRIGSVKTNIGHLDAAAGVAGFIKTVLALKHRLIPPTLNITLPNSRIDFKSSPFIVNDRLTQWKNHDYPLRAGVSSFGIGGTNAHVILEEWPGQSQPEKEESRRAQLLLLSAQTPTALEKMTGNLSEYLKKCLAHPGNYGSILGNTAYTLQVGRRSFRYKRMLVCSELEQAAAALSSPDLPGVRTFGAKEKNPRLVFMFPGQGSQYVNMGRGLYETESFFREKMDICFEILKSLMGYDIKEILYPPVNPEVSDVSGVSTQLQQTEIAQPLLFAFEYALSRLLMKWGLVPYAMIGHSIGEYVAACLSGVFPLETVLMVVALRGKLMQRMPTGEMLSVSLSEEKLQDLLTDEISLAAVNGPSRCVVSGPAPAIDSFIKRMNQRGYDCQYRRLHTSHAFHSAMVEPILKEFEQELNNVTYGTPKIPYISNVSGTWITVEEAVDPRYWARQLREPVRFHAGIQELSSSKRENIIFVEVGPGKTLTTLIKQDSVSEKTAVNLVRHPGEDIPDDYYLLSKIGQLWLYSIKVDWQALHMKEKRQRIPLPTYPFDRRRYWIDININQPGEKAFGPMLSYLKSREPGTTDSEPEKPNTRILSERPSLTTSYVAPQNEIEQKLVKLWEDFFGIDMIGTNDDFFELGGDSLKATSILAKIHKAMNLKLELTDIFKNPTIVKLAAHSLSTGAHLFTAISPSEQKEYYQLSSAQKRLYIIQQMTTNNTAYNMPLMILPREPLEKEKLESVFKGLTKRHESLRTSVIAVNEEPVQKIQAEINFSIRGIDVSEEEVEHIIYNFPRPFNLSQAPLLRVELLTINSTRQILLIDMHHIITDGTSQTILEKEFLELYSEEELPPLRLQYKDYAAWQNSERQRSLFKKQEQYWLETFADEVPVLNLPTDYQRPLLQSFEGNSLNFEIKEEETQALKTMALSRDSTLFMVLMAIYNILLSKLSCQEDIVVGVPIAGRRHVDLEKIIGMFVNTLSMRNYPVGERRFRDFLEDVKERALMAFENQEYPFEELVDKLSVRRDMGRNPLFDVMFAWQNMNTGLAGEEKKSETGTGRMVEPGFAKEYENIFQTAKFDLTLNAVEIGRGLFISFLFCTKLFKKETVERFIVYFKKIVSMVVKDRRIKLSEIDIISKEEKSQILNDLNQTKVEYPEDKTIHCLFEEQVKRTPDNIAVIGPSVQPIPGSSLKITYKELNEKSNLLAYDLMLRGVESDTIVSIMIERSIEMIIGILSILKSGGAYLPIDPDYPQDRIDYMLKDSNAYILLTSQEILGFSLPQALNNRPQGTSFHLHLSSSPATSLAYIIYTSGSTGKPKGVMVEHRNVVQLMFHHNHPFVFNNSDVWPMFHSYCFDFSVWEMYGALLYGGKLIIISKMTAKDTDRFLKILKKDSVTILNQTPTAFYNLVDEELTLINKSEKRELNLRYVIFGGEALKPVKLKEWKLNYPHTKLVNMYGITETTVHVTYKEIGAKEIDLNISNIGTPIPTLNSYVMDTYLNLLPIGVTAQLCISGAGVARGYLNRGQLTSEKFVENPFKRGKGEKMYRSGDMVRYLENGEMEYKGRIDFQVKIRGYRIELGEIESQLLKHEKIKEAVVLAKENNGTTSVDKNEDKYLCAYIVSNGKPTTSELRKHLNRSLPDFMIPSYFMELGNIPLTPNGKLDLKALPEPEPGLKDEYKAPRNELEKKLVALWEEILGRDELHTSQLKASIGIDDDFFELGGHSLKATILASMIHKIFDVRVPLVEIFKMPNIRALAGYIQGKGHESYISIEPAEKKEYYPLSSAQKRLYILQQMIPYSTAYNMPEMISLTAAFDLSKINETFKRMIKRHESLRISFHMVNDTPVQVIHAEVKLQIQRYWGDGEMEEWGNGMAPLGCGAPGLLEAFSDQYPKSQELRAKSFIKDFIRPFDLSKAPLLRVGLVNRIDGNNILLVDMHHIISDGVSHGILIKDFLALHEGEKLLPLRVQYKDFSEWQNGEKEKESLKHQGEYWLKVFAGEIPILELPTDYPRPIEQSFEGNSVNSEIKEEETQALKAMALSGGSTIFMVLMAIYNVLLSKLSSQEDIVVGTPIAGRRHTDLEKIIGMFVNTLSMRNYPVGERRFRDFLEDVKERTLMAFENQEYPFEELVDKLAVKRDMGRNPLFDVMFALQNMNTGLAGQEKESETGTSRLVEPASSREYENIFPTAKFDLTLNAEEIGRGLFVSFQFCTKLFKKETVERFIVYFKKIVSMVVKDRRIKLSEIEIIPEEEKSQVLNDLNQTEAEYPKDKTIHRLFEEQVERTPDNIAVIGPSVQSIYESSLKITYKELNEKSNRLAHELQIKGVGADTTVGIMLERSVEIIVGIMGILKSGGAYLPIDPDYPKDRIDYMLEDSSAVVLVTTHTLMAEGKKVRRCEGETVFLDSLPPAGKPNPRFPTANAPCSLLYAGPANLAYVIYTSGTTGKPKGVLIQHKNVVRLLFNDKFQFDFSDKDVWTLFHSYSFDFSVWELWGALLYGGRLIIIPHMAARDPGKFLEILKKQKVTVLNQTPSAFYYLSTEALKSPHPYLNIKYVIFGGEALKPIKLKKWKETYPGTKLINMYGITETTVHVTYKEITGDEIKINQGNIGKSIPTSSTYVMDKDLNVLPPGIAGELCVGGEGVGRGYLNHPELTQEKFVKNSSRPGERLYHSGDLVKLLDMTGEMEYLGRLDHQVKTRGYRIELGEIESQLLKHDDIKESIVLSKKDKNEDQYLCAYIVANKELEDADLRTFLSRYLPGYMIPSFFVQIENIPLNKNGKIDKNALPDPGIKTGEEFVGPRNEIEEKLVKIWADVLGIENEAIGIDANFFEIGGHSLKAIILIAKIHKELNAYITLAEFFNMRTIRELSAYIRRAEKNKYVEIKPAEKKDYYTLSSAQKRLYFLQQMNWNSTNYNLSNVLSLAKEVNKEKLEVIFKRLIARHDSLRTSFGMKEEHPVQRIHHEVEFKINDFQFKIGAGEPGIQKIIKDFLRPFDISRPPLFRVWLIKTAREKYILMYDLHHIIADGISQQLLIKEFFSLYAGEELPPLKLCYNDFLEWQKSQKQQELIKQQEAHWFKLFSNDKLPVLDLPTDFPRPAAPSFAGSRVNFQLNEKDFQKIKAIAAGAGATLYMCILTVLYILISKLCSQEDIVIGTPSSGRRHADLEHIVGMFVNTLAIRNYPSGEKTFEEFLNEVKVQTIKAFENQDYQFEDLVDKIGFNRDISRNPLFDVIFALEKIEVSQPGLSGPDLESYQYENEVSRFDLDVYGLERGENFYFSFIYCTKLFKKETVETFVQYFKEIISSVVKNPAKKISGIEMIPGEDRDRIYSVIQSDREEIGIELDI